MVSVFVESSIRFGFGVLEWGLAFWFGLGLWLEWVDDVGWGGGVGD